MKTVLNDRCLLDPATSAQDDRGWAQDGQGVGTSLWYTEIIEKQIDKLEEYALQVLDDHDVRFVRLWFSDVLGGLKSMAIFPADLEEAFENGVLFDGSAIEGLARGAESDVIAQPDASTLQMLPWRNDGSSTARMFCDILGTDGAPSGSDSRNVLKRTLARAQEMGFSLAAHPEIEFYLFEKAESFKKVSDLKPVDQGGYFDHVPRGKGQDFRRDVITNLEQMSIPVDFSHHEAGPGQNEINLRFDDALTIADNIMSFRVTVKEIALAHGMQASFMPKPLSDAPGSALHTHFALFDSQDQNVFFSESDPYNLSPIARNFMAGILHYANEISAVTNQYVNSYKRLWAGGEAPRAACWGQNNSSAMIRVPKKKQRDATKTVIELRSLDSASNPYLSFALVLAAGLEGIEQQMELEPEASNDIWGLTDLERRDLGLKLLPNSLGEAIELFEQSEFAKGVLGEDISAFIVQNKWAEWEKYRQQVTDFEIEQLFSQV